MSAWRDRPLPTKGRLVNRRVAAEEDWPYGRQRGFRRYKISSVGQMTVPASARRRWGLEGAGTVEVADLGFGVLILPGGGSDVLLDAWLASGELEAEAEALLAALSGEGSGSTGGER